MRHHALNTDFKFVVPPMDFDKSTDKELLQYCLGGVLYMPGTKNIIDKILSRRPPSPSMVMCFEDAIQESEVGSAETNVLDHLLSLHKALVGQTIKTADVPLIFVRVRGAEQFERFASQLTPETASILSGFVFPKFYSENARLYLDRVASLNEQFGTRLYAMPILEGQTIAFLETRDNELINLKGIVDSYREWILNIRVGGTDFSSLFGVRRDINTSIYNIMVVRDCLADILNVFNRDDGGYVVSAPVWEYFLAYKKEDINRLLHDDSHTALFRRSQIINEAIDGLVREVVMDKANGFVGKTIIHPSHLPFVNAMQAVTREEYEDARQILEASGGVVKSRSLNKMNEINPHRSWAHRIARRADAYGVLENEKAYLDLILGNANLHEPQ